MVFGQVDQHSSGAAALSSSAEAAITDPSACRTSPLRIQQSISNFLSIAITETRATELSPHSHTLWVAARGLGVNCLLTTLVAGRASGTVVDLLSHVGADQVKLILADVLYWTYHMGDC